MPQSESLVWNGSEDYFDSHSSTHHLRKKYYIFPEKARDFLLHFFVLFNVLGSSLKKTTEESNIAFNLFIAIKHF